MSTSVTIKTCYATTTVEVEMDDLNFADFFEKVLEPCLHGAGWNQDMIDRYLGDA